MVVEKLGLDLSPPRLLYESLVPGASVPGTRLALTHPSSSSYVLYTFFTMPTYPTIPMSASVTTGLELSSLLANLTTCNKQILVHLRNVSCMIQAAKVQDSTKRTIFFLKGWSIIGWNLHYSITFPLLTCTHNCEENSTFSQHDTSTFTLPFSPMLPTIKTLLWCSHAAVIIGMFDLYRVCASCSWNFIGKTTKPSACHEM